MDYFYINNIDKLNKFSLPKTMCVKLFIYNICLEKQHPFMQTLLVKENNQLFFPNYFPHKEIRVKDILFASLQFINSFSINNYNESNLSYHGYYEFKDEYICFIDCNQIDIINKYYDSNDVLFFFPWTEIIYEKQCKLDNKSLDISINLYQNFKIKNTQSNEDYPSPIIGYSISTLEQSKFINIFGENCSILPFGRLFRIYSDKHDAMEEYRKKDHAQSFVINKIAIFGKSIAVHKNDFSIGLFDKYDIIISNSIEKSYLFFMERDIQLPLSSYKL